jgi:hypothetical protein
VLTALRVFVLLVYLPVKGLPRVLFTLAIGAHWQSPNLPLGFTPPVYYKKFTPVLTGLLSSIFMVHSSVQGLPCVLLTLAIGAYWQSLNLPSGFTPAIYCDTFTSVLTGLLASTSIGYSSVKGLPCVLVTLAIGYWQFLNLPSNFTLAVC